MKDKNGKKIAVGSIMVSSATESQAKVVSVNSKGITIDYVNGLVEIGEKFLRSEYCVWSVK